MKEPDHGVFRDFRNRRFACPASGGFSWPRGQVFGNLCDLTASGNFGGCAGGAKLLECLVGVRGFEPPTPASRRQCSTRLSYTPTVAGGIAQL